MEGFLVQGLSPSQVTLYLLTLHPILVKIIRNGWAQMAKFEMGLTELADRSCHTFEFGHFGHFTC